jgi:hypothetical protein
MLCARFEVEQHVAEADIGRLLSSLQTEGLIETWSRPEQP